MPERAGEFERLEIAAERDPFAVLLQPFLVDRFETDEDVFEPELSPKAEHVLVAQQHVAAGLEVILLADAGADDRLGDFHAVPLLHKGDVVDDKDAGLADRAEILDDALRADQPVAAAVKGPGAAEGAVPRAAARELDRGAGIERAEKIFAAMAQQVARRHQIVERMDKAGRRAFAGRGDRAGNRGDIASRLDAPRGAAASPLRPRPSAHSRSPPPRARSALSR